MANQSNFVVLSMFRFELNSNCRVGVGVGVALNGATKRISFVVTARDKFNLLLTNGSLLETMRFAERNLGARSER